MKIIILEATAEELRANKRVADAIVDVLTNMCDSIARIPCPDLSTDDENEVTMVERIEEVIADDE